jgi:hypothetical protein
MAGLPTLKGTNSSLQIFNFQKQSGSFLISLDPVDGIADRHPHLLHHKRLLNIVIGTQSQGLNGGFKTAKTRYQNTKDMRIEGSDLPQQGKTIHTGHIEIRDKDIEIACRQQLDGGKTIGSKLYGGISLFDRFGKNFEKYFVIIGHEDTYDGFMFLHNLGLNLP